MLICLEHHHFCPCLLLLRCQTLVSPLPTWRTHFCGGVPPIENLPRDKHFALRATGVMEVTFLQYYDCVPHVVVGEIYPVVGVFNRPPLAPLRRALNCSCSLWGQDSIHLCLFCLAGAGGRVSARDVPTDPIHLLPVGLQRPCCQIYIALWAPCA